MDNLEVSCICPSFVFSEVLAVLPRALGWLGLKGVLGELPPLSALPVMGHFASGLGLPPSERETPLSSVWMHCFHTPQVQCCCVRRPMRARLRRAALTSWLAIGCPRRGGVCRKAGLQLTATEFRLSLLHHLKAKFSRYGRRLPEYNKQGMRTIYMEISSSGCSEGTAAAWFYQMFLGLLWQRRGDRAKRGREVVPPPLLYFPPLNVWRVCCSMLHSVSVASGSQGNRVPLIQTKCLQGGTLEFYVTFWFEKKKKNGQAWISAACLGWSIKWVFISKNRTIDYSTETIWILGGILIFWF